MPKRFQIVRAPGPELKITVIGWEEADTLEEAKQTAARLANVKDENFYVLELVGTMTPPKWVGRKHSMRKATDYRHLKNRCPNCGHRLNVGTSKQCGVEIADAEDASSTTLCKCRRHKR